MSDLDQFKQTYFLECNDLLDVLEEQFTEIESGDYDDDALHAVFRAIHSIKGGAGAFGFDRLVSFTHSFETMLDLARDGNLELTQDIVNLCLRANDIVADMVSAAQADQPIGDDFGEDIRKEIEQASGSPEEDDVAGDYDDFEFVPVAVSFDEPEAAEVAEDVAVPEKTTWDITFKPHQALYERANEPLLLLRELGELGELTATPLIETIPEFEDYDPLVPIIAWKLVLHADCTQADIAEVFDFVEGDCDLTIEKQAGDDAASEGSFSFADLADDLLGDADDSREPDSGADTSFAALLDDVSGPSDVTVQSNSANAEPPAAASAKPKDVAETDPVKKKQLETSG